MGIHGAMNLSLMETDHFETVIQNQNLKQNNKCLQKVLNSFQNNQMFKASFGVQIQYI